MFSILRPSRPINPVADLAEASLFYWFSKSGFKCAKVENNGIDFLAKNLNSSEILGLSIWSIVKGKEVQKQPIIIPLGELDRVRASCLRFSCKPYFALHLIQENEMWFFIMSLEHMASIYTKTRSNIECGMTQEDIDRYLADPEIVCIEINHKVWRWFERPTQT